MPRAGEAPVARIRVRHAASLDGAALSEMFSALTACGPLAQAALETEEVEVPLDCAECGYSGAVDGDHLYGHLRVCTACGAVSDDDGVAELELVDVVVSGGSTLRPESVSGGEAASAEEAVQPVNGFHRF
jgi:hypothetical protein